MNAPIALFAHRRLGHLQATVEALQQNHGARESDLIVYSDGPRTLHEVRVVEEVRSFAASIGGFRSVTIRAHERNIGLSHSIVSGVTEVLSDSPSVIVIEDDLVTSRHFLSYMNEALEAFSEDSRVGSIHGYVYPVYVELPDAFFLRGADCWGWATWQRSWSLYRHDAAHLLDELQRRHLIKEFDLDGAYPYSNMLALAASGANESWAVRWHASCFLEDKLTLYPGQSLVQNIGNDGSGTNSGDSDRFAVSLSDKRVDLTGLVVEPSESARNAFKEFLSESGNGSSKLHIRLREAKSVSRRLVRDWLPVGLRRGIERLLGRLGRSARYEDGYATWDSAYDAADGYDSESVLSAVLEATLAVRRGEAAFERDSMLFDEAEYPWPLLSAVMWAAARNGGRLDVLDVGGALGSTFSLLSPFLDSLPLVHWSVVEQASFVAAASEHRLGGQRLQFFNTIDECLGQRRPNMAILSSVLQYLEDPEETLQRVTDSSVDVLMIDRTPFSDSPEVQLAVQHVPSSIYRSSYPMWILSRNVLKTQLERDWLLVGEARAEPGDAVTASGLPFRFEAMIYVRRTGVGFT